MPKAHPHPPPIAAAIPTRRPDIDALRVVAIVTVFLVHCAQVFSPLQYWRIQNPERSASLGQLTLLAWPWVMPLFMLLAGAGAWYALGRRDDRSFLVERSWRLALPTVVGALILIPPQIWVERLAQGRFTGSLWAFLPRFFEGFYPEGNLSAGHLWFLAYLYVYAVLTLPLLRGMRAPGGELRVATRVQGILDGPWRLALLPALPIAVTQVALREPFPETLALVNDWANHGILLLTYLYGFLLVGTPDLEPRLRRAWPVALPLALTASAWISWSVWTSSEPGFLPRGYTPEYVLFWVAFSVASWCWIVALLAGARALVRKRNPVLDWSAQGVFLFYVLHQTVIVLLAYDIVRWDAAISRKFLVLVTGSLATTLALVQAARFWAPTQAMFGLRRR